MRPYLILIICALLLYSIGIDAQNNSQLKNKSRKTLNQDIPDKEWSNLIFKGNIPFNQIEVLFEKDWEGKEIKKGSGYKPFRRLEYQLASRIDTNGLRPNPMKEVMELETIKRKRSKRNEKSANSAWVSLGPNKEPDNNNGVGRINVLAFHPNNSNKLFAGSPAGGLWTTDNGGTSWYTLTDNFQNLGVSDITFDPTNANVMYLATGDRDGADTRTYGILKSTDGGQTWALTNFRPNYNGLPSFYLIDRILIDPHNKNNMLVATTEGIFRSTNAGSSWAAVLTDKRMRHMEYKPGNSSIVYASMDDYNATGANSAFYRSTNGGVSWAQINIPNVSLIERMAIAVTPANPSIVYLSAAYESEDNNNFYALYKSTNSGASFVKLNVGTIPTLGSQSWYDWTLTVSPTNANVLFAGGVGLYKSFDGGLNWNYASRDLNYNYVHVDHHYSGWHPITGELFVASDGGIWKTANNGNQWTPRNNGLAITQYYRISNAEVGANKVVGGAQDNGTHKKTGNSWEWISGGDGMDNEIDFQNSQNIYTSSQRGYFMRSTDGGDNFVEMIRASNQNETGAWVSPIKMDPNNPSTMYVGFQSIFKTTNKGVTWTNVGPYVSNLSLTYIDVAKSNSNILYALDRMDLYKSTNGGYSWELLNVEALGNYPNLNWIEIDPNNANHLWVTSYYGVYESTNGGATWIDVSGSLPDVPVNTIVYDEGSNGGLYVGTDLGVFFKDNSMSDWQEYGIGLPNVQINELDILESSNILRAGTFGRGIWEVPIGDVPTGFSNLSCYNLGTLSASGTTISINNHRVINNGTMSSPASTVGYYLSSDAAITTSDYLIGSNSLPALAKNSIITKSFTGTIPESIPSGTYYVGIVIDYNGVVSESNENDNSCYYNAPKLTVSQIAHDCQYSTVYVNGTITNNSKYVASNKVISKGILYSGRNSYMRAANAIELNPGFEVKSGALLTTQIGACGDGSSSNVLIQNSNHVITYSELGSNIKFTIDAISDETNQLNGSYPNLDFFNITVDKNRNGVVDPYIDPGYSTSSNSNDICNYYRLSCSSSTRCGYFNTGASYQSKFSNSDNSNRNHIIHDITIPKSELSTSGLAHVVIRLYEGGKGSTIYPTNNDGCFNTTLQLNW